METSELCNGAVNVKVKWAMLSDVSKDLESKTKIKDRAKLLGPKAKASRRQGQRQKSMLTMIRKFICIVKTWQTPMTS